MAPERIKIRKIDDPTSRQVTFSKRRRGIFKKAEELSILCDVELALIIFSANGKLSEFSTTSTKEIVERYNIHSKNLKIPDQPSLDLNLEDGNNARLHRQVEERNHQLREMRGEDLEGLTIEELNQLEKTLETGLSRVIERKSKQLMEQINGLRQKVVMSKAGKQVVTNLENVFYEEGYGSESVTNASNSSGPQGYDDGSVTSLKLGLPGSC